MQKATVILLFIVAFTVSGCNTTALPTQPVVESQATAFPTLTPSPLPTATIPPATPTLTPEPGLQTSGPYFTYFREMNGEYQLVMMDAGGGGRRIVYLPQDVVDSLTNQQFGLEMKFVSPNGKWLAFYTGTAGKYGEMPDQGESDLTLNLLNLATGKKQILTPLLSKNYPNNFAEAAKTLNDPYKTAESLYYAFTIGITQAISWSPDGRYLAFAGQMDGLSSDLYIYDVNTQKIQRLSSGDQELQWLNWSPDGKWILQASVFNVGAGMSFDIYAVNVDGSSSRYVSTNSLYKGIEKWLNAHTYFENDNQNGPGDYGLRLVDIDTGKITKVWDGAYFSYSLNSDGEQLMVNAMLPDISPYLYSGNDSDFRPGPYLVDLKTFKKTKIKFLSDGIFVDYESFPFNLNGQEFILIGHTPQAYFLSEKMELSFLDLKDARISMSPDKAYWISITSDSITIYSLDSIPLKTVMLDISDANQCDFAWSQNSAGLFLVCDSNVYWVDILTGAIRLVEINRMEIYFSPNFIWVGG